MAPVALITGASRGLGWALGRELAWRGWKLIIDARGVTALEAARQALAVQTHVVAIAGDITNPAHRAALVQAAHALGGIDALIHNASELGPSPRPALRDFAPHALEHVLNTNVVAPLALTQAIWSELVPAARIIAVSSDAAIEPYAGWGGYGASKAALDHMFAILAAEHPDRRIYVVDPGDMQTQMHQDAFPDQDISDRPLPETSVPGFMALLDGALPSGRYQARAVGIAPAEAQQ